MKNVMSSLLIISGEDSKRFNEILQSGEHFRVSPEEKKRIKNLVESVLANSKLSNKNFK
jgi:hypothetical protein